MRRECRERFPCHWLQWKPLVRDPDMHHDTCVTHVPWCMSESLTHGGGEDLWDMCLELSDCSVIFQVSQQQWSWRLYQITAPYNNFNTPIMIWWRHQMGTFSTLLAFARGIHRSPVNSPHKGQWRGASMFSLICALNKQLSKQYWGWWFEMPLRPLWRRCNGGLKKTVVLSTSHLRLSGWQLMSWHGSMHTHPNYNQHETLP